MHNNAGETLLQSAARHGVLIAAHKGTFGGNIIQNTIASFEAALLGGAHILEVDAAQSTDGVFYAFHTGQEPGLIGTKKRLDTMHSREIDTLRYINSNQCRTQEAVNRLDDILEHFKNRCFINLDRGYFYTGDVLRLIRRHQMEDQIIFKCAPEQDWLRLLETVAPQVMFMPVIRHTGELAMVRPYKLRLIGAEVLFDTESSELAAEPFISHCHQKRLLLWANAITLDSSTKLSAGHDDDTALLQRMDAGWGWLMDRGFDIIQTDWPFFLAGYINKRKLYDPQQ